MIFGFGSSRAEFAMGKPPCAIDTMSLRLREVVACDWIGSFVRPSIISVDRAAGRDTGNPHPTGGCPLLPAVLVDPVLRVGAWSVYGGRAGCYSTRFISVTANPRRVYLCMASSLLSRALQAE
ncbi:predicted protein [Plenodomus lingam JN3]|uniref:Predicted protein n=1 Tax=Leptosphaeria maculans (strain JN3 / isolate v23.1.3 / race Av1-4-5-6-7-8) TaxID=985895 RepID=E5A3C7_LEPMJ|nr:predicted protein [Plenodomus lingam JN3]CBX98140.1 predicted protein [Plenodomus lingam JN3]